MMHDKILTLSNRHILPTLRFRRLRGDMIETYKILTGKYDKSVMDFMPMQNSSSTSLPTRGHSLKLYQQRLEKGLRQNRRWNQAGFSNLTPEGQHAPNGGKHVQINPRIRYL